MDTVNDLLLQSAARLYSLGVELDGARETLRQLVAAKASYDSPEVWSAYCEYLHLKRLWDTLESDHLALRGKLQNKRR